MMIEFYRLRKERASLDNLVCLSKWLVTHNVAGTRDGERMGMKLDQAGWGLDDLEV